MLVVKDPIGFRLIRNIILISTFFSIIATGTQLYIDYKSETDLMELRLSQVKDSSLESLSHTLWQSNIELVQIQLKNLLSFHDISYVSIQDGGETVYQYGRNVRDDSIEKQYELSYVYNNKKHDLGVLTLQSDLKQARDKVMDRLFLIALTQSVKTFVVAFIVLYVFSYMITRHLYKIAEYTYEIAANDSGVGALKLDLRGKEDELKLLENALNVLRASLHSKLDQTRKEKERLGDLNAILEKRIDRGEELSDQVLVKKKDIEELEHMINMIKENSSDNESFEDTKRDVGALRILMQRVLNKE